MSQGYDPSQSLHQDPQGGIPAVTAEQLNRRSSGASPFASGPVATLNQVRPGAGFGVPPGAAPFRPQTSSQLQTPLGHTPFSSPPPTVPDANAYPPAQFQTHQFDTAPLDASLVHQFQTTNLNAPPDNYFGSSIQQEDPFQNVPDPSFPISSTAFQAPPPRPSAAALSQGSPFSSNFNSIDSGGSDPFATSDPSNLFSHPPPLPPTRRDSFNNPFETVPVTSGADPFGQPAPYHQTTAATPPPPAAPFLNYSTTPQQPQPHHMPSPTMYNQASPAAMGYNASPKVPQRPPPSPQQPRTPTQARDISVVPRTVDDLFQEFMSNVAPDKLPTAPVNIYELPHTLAVLQNLYREQQWQQLESKAWSMLGTPDPEFNLHVHAWAMVALMKQGKVDDLEQQVIVLGDLDHAQYQYDTYPDKFNDKTGSFVPMRLRYMTIQLPRLKNNVMMYETMASQLLVELLKNTFNLAPTDAFEWHQIVGINLVTSFIDRKKFDLALRLATSLYNTQRERADLRQRVLLASRLGRLHLQVGDLKGAEALFADAASINQQIDQHDCASRLLLNQGLLFFAHNKFKEALDVFNTILGVHSDDEPAEASDEPFASWDDGDVVSCAANNMSICALYSCEVQTAVTVLETILQSDPRRHLHSAVVFNLSTLYDLVCDNTNSTNRKEMIKRLAETYGVEHIDATCFRI
ncbi:Aste57867_23270 [Aphanomyces stellatus]|uniref:Aste57867_23270 protein n=1 Tax=Aphanomyces stellatus TaxID=120398 RepID=A0A485LP50_9STRA|nr:hypothetical protein As57867_023199 [Aphanomyces stellatus]VFT99915.1 Aste57867_23270 [Aphanomyces stellatus]